MRKAMAFLVLAAAVFLAGRPVIGQQKPDNIDDIVRFFNTGKPADRAAALGSLGVLGAKAKGVTKTVLDGLADGDAEVQRVAKQAIAKVNPTIAEPAVNLVTGQTYEARLSGVQGLAKIGPDAMPAVPALLTFLKQAKPEDRGKVVVALADVGIKDQQMAVLIATMALRDPDPSIRAAALAALPKMEFSRDQVNLFLKALEEKDAKVRTSSLQMLATIGKNNPSVIQALEAAAKNDLDPAVREEAKKALALARGGK